MTEEIIIDGVNVAECEHYTTMEDCDGIHDLCEQLDDYCSIKKNCYYKQLKRLEQENKELKKFFNSAAKKNTSLENKIKEYREQYDELYWTTDQLAKDKTKLKQTLEEISGLASPHCTQCSQIINIIKEVLK